jgi:hypothetical protein
LGNLRFDESWMKFLNNPLGWLRSVNDDRLRLLNQTSDARCRRRPRKHKQKLFSLLLHHGLKGILTAISSLRSAAGSTEVRVSRIVAFLF